MPTLLPSLSTPPVVTITPYHEESMGRFLAASNTSFTASGTSAVWPSANLALFFPFTVAEPTLVRRMFVYNGATASGQTDVGIYTTDGARITSAGANALALLQVGVSVMQYFDIADVTLMPGDYFLAISKNDTTGTVFRAGPVLALVRANGVLHMATAHPLPATATFAAPTLTGNIPLFGLTTRTV